MKLPHRFKLRLSIYGGILISYFTLLYGLGWSLEWDANSGRERRVTEVWGVPLSRSEPSETIISQWRNSSRTEENWVEVFSGPNHGMPGECIGRVLYHFDLLADKVPGADAKQAYASWVLDELGETSGICPLSEHCRRMVLALYETHEPVSVERLEQVWRYTKSASLDAEANGS